MDHLTLTESIYIVYTEYSPLPSFQTMDLDDTLLPLLFYLLQFILQQVLQDLIIPIYLYHAWMNAR